MERATSLPSTLQRLRLHMGKLQEAMPFEIEQEVKVPAEVHPSGKATIVGYEWGPHAKPKSNSWQYSLRFSEGGEWWRVTEEELLKWQS